MEAFRRLLEAYARQCPALSLKESLSSQLAVEKFAEVGLVFLSRPLCSPPTAFLGTRRVMSVGPGHLTVLP